MPDTHPDPWHDFRTLTAARIALGRAGASLPTRELLDFGLAHARARDAVLSWFDADQVVRDLQSSGLKTIEVASAAATRDEYLRRPDLGRCLSQESHQQLRAMGEQSPNCDLVMIVSDGLSALAAQRHAAAVIRPLHDRLTSDGWMIAPIVVARFGRVALEDEIGTLLGATIALILLGERPGLGSPDSLGAYFVHSPRPGRIDADRNCVSNIHPGGLSPAGAVDTLHHLLTTSRHRKISGVELKDERVLQRTRPQSLLTCGRFIFSH
jgi:ethanolamine ammonia-lyase small subunit